ncbi:Ankyrin repeat-containing domain protein [Akanthomyces lecanii RCEF 1005]|uniref:Ankyrin repeat-containing domain protein n=1 Tax=Akanthomyces lecanii RCEF 1005 TaxID=1081108 RepID=A0A168G8V5_CORDF|nr:Ankyrin repeat-containing domain protein [Akanthomyces lecanii RCEF 1005]
MSLITLPPEMLLRIAELLPFSHDLNSLLRCCQTFYGRLNHFLYHRNNCAQQAAEYALDHNSILPLQGLKRVGISLKDCGVDVLHEAAEAGLFGPINYILDTGEIGIDSCGYQNTDSWGYEDDDKYEREGGTPLYLAVVQGDGRTARLLLDRGADPSADTGPEHTRYPLIAALRGRHYSLAKMLVDAGADITCRDFSDDTPIICAAMTGNLEMVTLLLDRGADIFTTSRNGLCLFLAAFTIGSNPSLVEMLLDRGGLAPEDEVNSYLASAVQRGWYNVIKLLIEKGADLEYKPVERPVPLLVVSIIIDRFDIAELLIQKGADVNARDYDQSCALHYTRQEEHLPLVKSLLAAGADVLATDAQGCQPLMLADSVAIVEVLLANGANYENSSEMYDKALMRAIIQHRFDIAEALLQAGASTRGSDDFSLVQFACQIGGLRLVELLIDYGADISSNNPLGMSTLFIAAKGGRVSMVKLLLVRGADVEEADRDGYTPLMIAARNGHRGIVSILVGHGANLEITDESSYTVLLAAAEEVQAEVVDILISLGANTQAKNCTGSNALIIAAALPNNKATVDRLLRDGGIDVDAQNIYGRTALFNAAMRGQAEAVESLLAHQPPADLTAKDHWGTTTLSMAVRNGHTRIVEMLLAAHDPSEPILGTKDNQGRTVLDWARRTATGEIWRMLAATREGAAVDVIEDAEEAMMRFRPTKCFCDNTHRIQAAQAPS